MSLVPEGGAALLLAINRQGHTLQPDRRRTISRMEKPDDSDQSGHGCDSCCLRRLLSVNSGNKSKTEDRGYVSNAHGVHCCTRESRSVADLVVSCPKQ